MRKGFTLIELGMSMCILLVVLSFSSIGIRFYKKYADEIKYTESIFEVEEFLSRAKGRAINKNKSEEVYIEKQKNSYSIKLVEEGLLIECLELGETWDLIESNINTIGINNLGFIESCTIRMKKDNNRYKITIQAGGNLISDYKE